MCVDVAGPAQESITSSAAVPGPPLTVEITIDADVAVVSNLKELEASYGHMLVKVNRYLKKCNLSEAKLFLDLTIEAKAFDMCETFEQLLKKLRDDAHIDVFNIYILLEFKKLFDDDDIKQEIEAYNGKKDNFFRNTTISTFQRAVVSQVEHFPMNERIEVTIKIPKDSVYQVTLKDIEELAKNGFGEENYRRFMHLHARAGCVLVFWSVPKKLNDELQQLARKNAGVFQENGVVEVTVGGTRVFPSTHQVSIKLML